MIVFDRTMNSFSVNSTARTMNSYSVNSTARRTDRGEVLLLREDILRCNLKK